PPGRRRRRLRRPAPRAAPDPGRGPGAPRRPPGIRPPGDGTHPRVRVTGAGSDRAAPDSPAQLTNVGGATPLPPVTRGALAALRTARAVAERTVVVIGPNAAAVRAAADAGVTFVEQRERLGTGHALEQARAACGDGPVVVLAGDMPLLSSETLERLVSHHRTTSAAATVLTAVVDRP